MTVEWKQAIRNQRNEVCDSVRKEPYGPENFDLKKKHRNIATQERRKPIKVAPKIGRVQN